jgi:hypothetical protein
MFSVFMFYVLSVFLALIAPRAAAQPLNVSGIYPHLSLFNDHGECGIGAVVPWADRLWLITYPPHFRTGSTDKLYSIDDQLNLTIHKESVGGTHANRLIHRESNQLIIGPYFIDDKGNVRAADVKNKLVGRMTATARHLTDPANKVYMFDMEGPIYEVNVHTLELNRLFVKPVPGWHGKGAYSGQGVLVIANNGESPGGGIEKLPFETDPKTWSKGPEDAGALAEWDGKQWKVILRRQFTEVTGPGGIHGAPENDPDAPIWATGWDKRSVILAVRDARQGGQGGDNPWAIYRLPKASHTFDPQHGWFTEWPRIREIAPGKFMMVMHGMMFDFPQNFRPGQTAGIRPIASHLRYIPDFCHWNGKVVLAADDTSIMQNPLAGISQSNLWFGTPDELKQFGSQAGWGGVWMGDHVKANQPSDPYLLAGFQKRTLHLSHQADAEVTFTIEIDEKGDGNWKVSQTIKVPAKSYKPHILPPDLKGEWIRLTPDKDCQVSAYFHYLTPPDRLEPDPMFRCLATAAEITPQLTFGHVRPGKEKQLQYFDEVRGIYYEVDEKLRFQAFDDRARVIDMGKALAGPEPPFSIRMDGSSVLIQSNSGRYRLPVHSSLWNPRLREVASERYLANIAGTFYEIPRMPTGQAAPDFLRMKPIASHRYNIRDYCTWRGLLVLTGTTPKAPADGHFFKSPDNKSGLWFGKTDDLWKLGKPRGAGGPWHNTPVTANTPSDPFLVTNFDKKSLTLSHDAKDPVTFTIQINFMNNQTWRTYHKITAPPGQPATHDFPDGYQAHWARLLTDKPCTATATFTYE